MKLYDAKFASLNPDDKIEMAKAVAEEALGKDDFDFYPFDVAQEKRTQDIEIARTGVEKHWITEEHDQNGKSIFLDKRKIRIESDDFPPILLSIEWDITEMERMKRELLVA